MTLYPGNSGSPFYLANECPAVVCTTDNGPVAIVRTGTATIGGGSE